MDFVSELKWRGMIHDISPGTEELLQKEKITAYVGIDPTADSLHIGHFVSVMALKHLQLKGHKPIALVGGATGMIGDPSGKSEERNLLDEEVLRHNESSIKSQLMRFLDFGKTDNAAELVNNFDWFKEMKYLDFIRDIGKHITINYMMAKESVKQRLETGISFTEFTYQLAQGYDYLYLHQNKYCRLQMGGSDQWGNIVTGTELIRRIHQGEAYALTWPLITKSDGKKFGKTESGNVWLDKERTSPYKFYQYWLNSSDEDAEKYMKIFTLFNKDEISEMVQDHREKPHERLLQKALAKDMTIRVHSEEDYSQSLEASQILFGRTTREILSSLDEKSFLDVFEGVPQFTIDRDSMRSEINVMDLLVEKTDVLKSKGEARRAIKENSLSINKEKISSPDLMIGNEYLINDKYLLVQRGKKNYFLISVT